MPRPKREFGTIRRRANGRYQAYYLGPDQGFHRAPSTSDTKMDAEAWLAKERKLLQDDNLDACALASRQGAGPSRPGSAWCGVGQLRARRRGAG